MAKGTRIAVIIPVYNEELQLGKENKTHFRSALQKWLKFDNANRRVVFVDDGSADKTREIIQRDGFEVIPSDPKKRNLGKGDAVIIGAQEVLKDPKLDAVVLFDADILN